MDSPWLDGWRERARAQLKQHGFNTLSEYVRNYGISSFEEIGRRLALNLVPVQIEKILRDEASNTASFQFFARALLVFEMHRGCPMGWWNHSEWDRNLATAPWGGALGEINTSQADAVWHRLRSRRDLPTNWLPSGPDDPTILEVFDGIEFRKALPGPQQ